jgi:hypothetical protein
VPSVFKTTRWGIATRQVLNDQDLALLKIPTNKGMEGEVVTKVEGAIPTRATEVLPLVLAFNPATALAKADVEEGVHHGGTEENASTSKNIGAGKSLKLGSLSLILILRTP